MLVCIWTQIPSLPTLPPVLEIFFCLSVSQKQKTPLPLHRYVLLPAQPPSKQEKAPSIERTENSLIALQAKSGGVAFLPVAFA